MSYLTNRRFKTTLYNVHTCTISYIIAKIARKRM